jgi:hypothetical protein
MGILANVPDSLGGHEKPAVYSGFLSGRYWARTSDPQLVELVLSQLS